MGILSFFIIFSLFLFVPLATAVEIDMKTNFSEGETLFAKISGNFYEPISKEDIKFNKDHIKTSIIPFVTEIDDVFYIYAQLSGKFPGNYSIILENARYFQGNNLIEEDISKNFAIKENLSEFLVDPGFVVTDEDFFIEVRNLQNKKISVGWRILNEFSSVDGEESEGSKGFFAALFGGIRDSESGTLTDLKAGETKKINFEIEDFGKFNIIEMSSGSLIYEVPVSVFSIKESGMVGNEEENKTNESIGEIVVEITEEFSEESVGEITGETCFDLGGQICDSDNQKCEGSIDYATDGTCCIGTCKDIEEPSSLGSIIGWVIIVAVLSGVVWFYLKRYKGARGISDLTRILKKK